MSLSNQFQRFAINGIIALGFLGAGVMGTDDIFEITDATKKRTILVDSAEKKIEKGLAVSFAEAKALSEQKSRDNKRAALWCLSAMGLLLKPESKQSM